MSERTFWGLLTALIVLAFWAMVGTIISIIVLIEVFLDFAFR